MNNGEFLVKEILDRAANTQWKSMFRNAIIENHIPYGSNHGPIVLNLFSKRNYLPRPFRFEWMWTQDQDCKTEIENSWNQRNNNLKYKKVTRT